MGPRSSNLCGPRVDCSVARDGGDHEASWKLWQSAAWCWYRRDACTHIHTHTSAHMYAWASSRDIPRDGAYRVLLKWPSKFNEERVDFQKTLLESSENHLWKKWTPMRTLHDFHRKYPKQTPDLYARVRCIKLQEQNRNLRRQVQHKKEEPEQ